MSKRSRNKGERRPGEEGAGLSQNVMDSFSDAVYIIDVRNYRVLACNAAFLQKHGLSRDQVLGRPCYELTHQLSKPCRDPFDICPLKETLRTGRHCRTEQSISWPRAKRSTKSSPPRRFSSRTAGS